MLSNRAPLGVVLVVSLFTAVGAAEKDAEGPTMEEFSVTRPWGELVVTVFTPPAGKLSKQPMLLLSFSSDRRSSLPGGRYGAPTQAFLDQGHRIASFDLPLHGGRVDRHGSGIAGFSKCIVAGEDPFATFVQDGTAVIDELLKRGLASPGRIVASGVSRAGYCVLRLAAAESRIQAAAALAPVTDWTALREFAKVAKHPGVTSLALTNFARELAGKRIYIAIGNFDDRVDTAACTRLVLAINEAEQQQKVAKSQLRYLIVDDSQGHSLAARWRQEGIRFLLQTQRSSSDGDLP